MTAARSLPFRLKSWSSQFVLYIIQFGNDESVNSLFTGTFRLLDNACILFGEQRYGAECFYQIIVSHRPEKAGLCGQRSIIASCNIRCNDSAGCYFPAQSYRVLSNNRLQSERWS